jgi:hypothetical protein
MSAEPTNQNNGASRAPAPCIPFKRLTWNNQGGCADAAIAA